MKKKKRVVIGLIGTVLDAGYGPERWEKWRPTISICQHEDFVVDRFDLLYPRPATKLARIICGDIESVSPETEAKTTLLDFRDAWDFEEVYAALHEFARNYPFDTEKEEYLIHITTGTHVSSCTPMTCVARQKLFASLARALQMKFPKETKVMANKSIFKSFAGKLIPATNATNEEKAPAYALSPKHALAQYAATGCLNATFYAGAEDQVKKVLALCNQIDATFIAKTAIFCRERGFMKDMPALLCAVLATKDSKVLQASFNQVIDDGKMLRNFVQILRSGIVGRKSLGTVPKKLVQKWLESRSDEALFKASVGQDPSLADVIKMVHPKPTSESRAALYAYLIGRKHNAAALPELVNQFEAFKATKTGKVPEVPFQMLTALELGKNEWIQIARNAPWQMTRMNLNTFARHGVFEVKEMTKMIANRLRDEQLIKKARVFPYQLMTAYVSADTKVPKDVREALQDAMEIALQNVPRIDGQVYVLPDVSGSMSSPATGLRAGSTTAVRCIDVAALVAAAFVRKNATAEVLPFESKVVDIELNPRDSVLTNAAKLAAIGGGGTNCSAPLAQLNRQRAKGDLVVFISDNESWMDARGGRGTATMQEWTVFKQRNPAAKLVCIDIQPYGTTQAAEREDILNIGGFSDQVFEVINEFAAGRLKADHWVGVIDKVEL